MHTRGLGICPAGDDVKPISPLEPESSILLRKWCVIISVHVELHSLLARCRSMETSAKNPVVTYPALLNTIPTWMSLVALMIGSMYPVRERSHPTHRTSTLSNFFCSSKCVSLSSLSSRATSTTLSPWEQSFSARALPIPLDDPVTSAHSVLYFFLRSWGRRKKARTKKWRKNVPSEMPMNHVAMSASMLPLAFSPREEKM
mmetsp:Transcript_16338/g.38372  ORF Transcript_16338/g.38372 Transcript_16338/m.38372 type:complete len:201 (-) Transcript_16338:7-609(-)